MTDLQHLSEAQAASTLQPLAAQPPQQHWALSAGAAAPGPETPLQWYLNYTRGRPQQEFLASPFIGRPRSTWIGPHGEAVQSSQQLQWASRFAEVYGEGAAPVDPASYAFVSGYFVADEPDQYNERPNWLPVATRTVADAGGPRIGMQRPPPHQDPAAGVQDVLDGSVFTTSSSARDFYNAAREALDLELHVSQQASSAQLKHDQHQEDELLVVQQQQKMRDLLVVQQEMALRMAAQLAHGMPAPLLHQPRQGYGYEQQGRNLNLDLQRTTGAEHQERLQATKWWYQEVQQPGGQRVVEHIHIFPAKGKAKTGQQVECHAKKKAEPEHVHATTDDNTAVLRTRTPAEPRAAEADVPQGARRDEDEHEDLHDVQTGSANEARGNELQTSAIEIVKDVYNYNKDLHRAYLPKSLALATSSSSHSHDLPGHDENHRFGKEKEKDEEVKVQPEWRSQDREKSEKFCSGEAPGVGRAGASTTATTTESAIAFSATPESTAQRQLRLPHGEHEARVTTKSAAAAIVVAEKSKSEARHVGIDDIRHIAAAAAIVVAENSKSEARHVDVDDIHHIAGILNKAIAIMAAKKDDEQSINEERKALVKDIHEVIARVQHRCERRDVDPVGRSFAQNRPSAASSAQQDFHFDKRSSQERGGRMYLYQQHEEGDSHQLRAAQGARAAQPHDTHLYHLREERAHPPPFRQRLNTDHVPPADVAPAEVLKYYADLESDRERNKTRIAAAPRHDRLAWHASPASLSEDVGRKPRKMRVGTVHGVSANARDESFQIGTMSRAGVADGLHNPEAQRHLSGRRYNVVEAPSSHHAPFSRRRSLESYAHRAQEHSGGFGSDFTSSQRRSEYWNTGSVQDKQHDHAPPRGIVMNSHVAEDRNVHLDRRHTRAHGSDHIHREHQPRTQSRNEESFTLDAGSRGGGNANEDSAASTPSSSFRQSISTVASTPPEAGPHAVEFPTRPPPKEPQQDDAHEDTLDVVGADGYRRSELNKEILHGEKKLRAAAGESAGATVKQGKRRSGGSKEEDKVHLVGNQMNVGRCIRLHEQFPDFGPCRTTQGTFTSFYDFLDQETSRTGCEWTLMSFHPAAFTCICTTELMDLCAKQEDFRKRGCKLVAFSCDPEEHQWQWAADVFSLYRRNKSIQTLVKSKKKKRGVAGGANQHGEEKAHDGKMNNPGTEQGEDPDESLGIAGTGKDGGKGGMFLTKVLVPPESGSGAAGENVADGDKWSGAGYFSNEKLQSMSSNSEASTSTSDFSGANNPTLLTSSNSTGNGKNETGSSTTSPAKSKNTPSCAPCAAARHSAGPTKDQRQQEEDSHSHSSGQSASTLVWDIPFVSDPGREVAKLLGLLDQAETRAEAELPLPVRGVYLLDPYAYTKMIMVYPISNGRNLDEILRTLDSLLLTTSCPFVGTPAGWVRGDRVVLMPGVTPEIAAEDLAITGLRPAQVNSVDDTQLLDTEFGPQLVAGDGNTSDGVALGFGIQDGDRGEREGGKAAGAAPLKVIREDAEEKYDSDIRSGGGGLLPGAGGASVVSRSSSQRSGLKRSPFVNPPDVLPYLYFGDMPSLALDGTKRSAQLAMAYHAVVPGTEQAEAFEKMRQQSGQSLDSNENDSTKTSKSGGEKDEQREMVTWREKVDGYLSAKALVRLEEQHKVKSGMKSKKKRGREQRHKEQERERE